MPHPLHESKASIFYSSERRITAGCTNTPELPLNTIWLGMRGRDAARKLTLKVNILQVFTIDFSEIQFIVNHNSQSDGQNNSAKTGMKLRKKIKHTNSLQRKGEDTKDNGILL